MSKSTHSAAVLAVLSLLATPIGAAELPRISAPGPVDSAAPEADDGLIAERHRRYRHRRHRGIDLGDIVRGALIIGAVATVADAARDAERERWERRERERDRDYEYDREREERDYRDRRNADRYVRDYTGEMTPATAAKACYDEVEQFGEVDGFDIVRREGNGWRVEGRMDDGEPFACSIDESGRVRELNRGDRDGSYAAFDDSQREIDYEAARARQSGYAYRLDARQDADSGEIDGDLYPG